jgi:hypothetical protein
MYIQIHNLIVVDVPRYLPGARAPLVLTQISHWIQNTYLYSNRQDTFRDFPNTLLLPHPKQRYTTLIMGRYLKSYVTYTSP